MHADELCPQNGNLSTVYLCPFRLDVGLKKTTVSASVTSGVRKIATTKGPRKPLPLHVVSSEQGIGCGMLDSCSARLHTCSGVDASTCRLHICNARVQTCTDRLHTFFQRVNTCTGKLHTCTSRLHTCTCKLHTCRLYTVLGESHLFSEVTFTNLPSILHCMEQVHIWDSSSANTHGTAKFCIFNL